MGHTRKAKSFEYVQLLLYLEFLNAWFFIYFAPLAILTGLVSAFRVKVYNTPRVLQPPYSPWVRAGTNTPLIPLCMALGWTLLTSIPHHCHWRSKRSWWFVVALVKFIIAAAFIPPIYFESKYLPRPLNSCRNDYRWPDPHSAPYGSPSMFFLIPDSYGRNRTRITSCKQLLTIWRFQIAMCVLVTVSAALATGVFVLFNRLEFMENVTEQRQWFPLISRNARVRSRVPSYQVSGNLPTVQ